MKLVAIDDEIHYLELIADYCTLLKIDVHTYSAWENSIVDNLNERCLLLLDINMPGMDGLDVLMELDKASYKGGVVIMSGTELALHESVSKLVSSLNLNLMGSLSKPFHLGELEAVIKDFSTMNPEVNGIIVPRKELSFTLDELKEGLKAGWIYPLYQPQINPRLGLYVGVECLSRVNHPIHGEIAVQDFIHILEKSDLIADYTYLLIENTLNECQSLLENHKLLTISFNISPTNLNKSFCLALLELINTTSIPLKKIILEITETNALFLSAEARYAITKFRLAGLSLSLDDFGTGYSTIEQLQELPFNEIKIDRTFVRYIEMNETSKAIVKATESLAKNLKYKIVAEGVETQLQLDTLQSLGNFIVQGYLFSKPLKLTELADLLRHQAI